MSKTTSSFAVLGLDKSGLAAVRHLIGAGKTVFAFDDKPEQCEKAQALGAQIVDLTTLDPATTELVLTPGVGGKHKVAQHFGGKFIGDIELFVRANPAARIVGITGTNGKSTTTALIHHILKSADVKAEIGGNFGTSPLDLPEAEVYVLELSSYQLERCPSLAVEVGIMLNLTPDHLERHGDMVGYAAAKANLFINGKGTALFGVDDDWSLAIGEAAASRGWDAQPLDIPPDGRFESFDFTQLATLPGLHNWQNAFAALLTCRAMGLSDDAIAAGLKSFPGLDHRQQLVATAANVRFINDSKATNADATAKALGCYADIYWVVGGLPKTGGLNGLEGYMPRIRRAFVIGQAAEAFGQWLQGKAPYEQCGTLDVATTKAAACALADGLDGAVVLLSPACASWDQFKNFEERGKLFASLASSLSSKEKGA